MNYFDGNSVRLGDVVQLGGDKEGVVVCSIDTCEYSKDFTAEQWSYLKTGVMVNFPKWGLIHYSEPEEDLKLLKRSVIE